MEVTYYGHSCFKIILNGKIVLFDPFISPNELAKDIDVNAIKTDYIILSHGHGDHVADVETVYKNNPNSTVIANNEVAGWFANKGIKNTHPMNQGGTWDFDFGSIKVVNAIHSSSMPDGSYGGNPVGFVIEAEGKTFYFAGDTALTYDMKLIKEEFDIDYAFLPLGSNFTMNVKDSIKAADFVGAKKVVGMHYDTFPYIKIDHTDAQTAYKNANVELLLMGIGETTNL